MQIESRSFSNNSSASRQRPAALAAHRAALQLAMLGVRPARIISLGVCFKLMLSQDFAKPQLINKGCTNFGVTPPMNSLSLLIRVDIADGLRSLLTNVN
jgi:hypothetical protein